MEDKKRAGNFYQKHVQGQHDPNKAKNHKAPFQDAEYKPVKPAGADSGARAAGKFEGQKKAVTRQELSYTETGRDNRGKEGSSLFMVTGKKDDGKFQAHHLDGPVQRSDRGTYLSPTHGELESASSETVPFDSVSQEDSQDT